jgi:hypothetical protein
MAEALVELAELVAGVGGRRDRDAPVGMEMIDVGERQEAVQRRVDRRGDGVLAERAQRIELDDLVFQRRAAVAAAQVVQLAQVQRGEPRALDAAEVAAAALDPQHLLRAAVERVGLRELGAGVAAAEVGDPEIRAEEVRAIAQQVRAIQAGGRAVVPAILEVAKRVFHVIPLVSSPRSSRRQRAAARRACAR